MEESVKKTFRIDVPKEEIEKIRAIYADEIKEKPKISYEDLIKITENIWDEKDPSADELVEESRKYLWSQKTKQ